MNDEHLKELPLKTGIKSRTINVDYLARVEGEGALYIRTKGNKVEDVKLKIFEPPRFFEALLCGREMGEAPDITARICGICPVAYQMSAAHAIENALKVTIPPHIHHLRRLLYCGEWIESHTLHVYMLHAPDFFGYPDAIQMSKAYPDVLKRGLRLKKAGNEIISVIGGREIHPINVKIGGFYKLPSKEQCTALIDPLKKARDDALATVLWVSGFEFPDLTREYECVSLNDTDEYPMTRGRILSTEGLNIAQDEYEEHFEEQQVPYSNALQSTIKGRGSYLVGPMARYNLNRHHLPTIVQEAIAHIGFEDKCINPFRSIIVRALEILFACDEALRILERYTWEKMPSCIHIEKKAATGFAATEAPRGLLYHRYLLGEDGLIKVAKIIPPTSQNQMIIEEDLRDFVEKNMDLPDSKLVWKCEQAIRNYDPCISCSAHFLKLERCHA
jgi:sulfhydrogenase subunit alpha